MPPKKGKSKNARTSSNSQAHVSGGKAIRHPAPVVVETLVSQPNEKSDVPPQAHVSGGEAIGHPASDVVETLVSQQNKSDDDDWMGHSFDNVSLTKSEEVKQLVLPPKSDKTTNFSGRHLPDPENETFPVDERKEMDLYQVVNLLHPQFMSMMKTKTKQLNEKLKSLNPFRCAVGGGGELAGKVRESRFDLKLPFHVLVQLSLQFFGLKTLSPQDMQTLKRIFGETTEGENVVEMFCSAPVPKEFLEDKAKAKLIRKFVRSYSFEAFTAIFDATMKNKQPNRDLFVHIVGLLLNKEMALKMSDHLDLDQYFNEFVMFILFKLNNESLFSSKRSTLDLVNISFEVLDGLHIFSSSTNELSTEQISKILLVIQIFKKLKKEPNTEDECLQIFQALFQCLTFKGKEDMLMLCFNHPHELEAYRKTMIEKSGPEHLNRLRGSKSTKGQINPVEMWDHLTKTQKKIHLWLHSIGCGKTTIALILALLDSVIHEKDIVYMGPETLANMTELSSICRAVQTFLDRNEVKMMINFVSGSPCFPKAASAKSSINLFVVKSLNEIAALSVYHSVNKLTVIIDDNTEVDLGKDLEWLMKSRCCDQIHLLGATLDLSAIDPKIMSEIDILGKSDGSTAICAAEPSGFLRGFPLSFKALSDMDRIMKDFLSSYQHVREIIGPVCSLLQSFANLEQTQSGDFVLSVQQILNKYDNQVFKFFYSREPFYQHENESEISFVKRKLSTLMKWILEMFPKTGIVPISGRFPRLDDLNQILITIFSAAEANSSMCVQEFLPAFQLPSTREFCSFFRTLNEFISQRCVRQYEDVARHLSAVVSFPVLESRFYDVSELNDLTKQATPIIDSLASFGLAFDCEVLTPPMRVRVSNRKPVMQQIIRSRDNGDGCPIVCLGPDDDFRTVCSELAEISFKRNRLIESQDDKRIIEVRENGQKPKKEKSAKPDKKDKKNSKESSKESSKEPSKEPSEEESKEKSSSASASASATSSSVAGDHRSPKQRLLMVFEDCKLNVRQTAHLPSRCDNQTAMNLLSESGSPEATRWLDHFCKGVAGLCQQMPHDFVKLCLDMYQKGKMILVVQEKIFHLQSVNFDCGEHSIFLYFLSEVSDAFAKQMIGRAGRVGSHVAGRFWWFTPSGQLIRSKTATQASVQDVSVLDSDNVENTLSKLPRRFVLELIRFLSECQFEQHETLALVEFLRLYQLLQYDKKMEYSCKYRDLDKIMRFMSSCGIVSFLSDFEFSSSAHIPERLTALAVNAESGLCQFNFTETREEFVKMILKELPDAIVPRALGLCQAIDEGTFLGIGIKRDSLVKIFMEISPLYQHRSLKHRSLSNLVDVFMSFLTNLQRSPAYAKDRDAQDHLLALITMMDYVNSSLQRLVEILTKVLTERDFDCFYSRKAVVLSPLDILRTFLETATTVDDVHQFFLQNPEGLEREFRRFCEIHSSFGPNSQTQQLLKESQVEFESLNAEIKDLRSKAAKRVGTFSVRERALAQQKDPEILSINAQISSIKTKIENLGQSIERAKCSLDETPQTEGEFLDFIRNIFK